MRVTNVLSLMLVALFALSGCASDQSPRAAVLRDGPQRSSEPSAKPPGVIPARVPSSDVRKNPQPRPPATVHVVCDGAALRLGVAGAEGAGTGQSAGLITLRNIGKTTCGLTGYPRLTALDAGGKTLPFTMRYGGNQSVTNQKPVTVITRPGGTAFVTFGKYRCDTGSKAVIRQVKVTLPGAQTPAVLDLASLGQALSYCGPGDPGSEIAVSPVEPTELRTRRH